MGLPLDSEAELGSSDLAVQSELEEVEDSEQDNEPATANTSQVSLLAATLRHQEKPHLKILYNSALSCRILHKNAKTDRIMQMFQIFQIFQITSLHQNGLENFPNFSEFFQNLASF